MRLIFSLSFVLALAGCAIDGNSSDGGNAENVVIESSQKSLNRRLAKAIKQHDIVGVRQALEGGADVNGEKGLSLLSFAAGIGDEEIVKLLLDRGADIEGGCLQFTALMSASMNGHTKIVKLLLDRGADIEAGADGCTSLSLALLFNNSETAELLKQRGAKLISERSNVS